MPKIYSNLISSWRLFECIDIDEYNALMDVKKDAVRIILSMGRVNFSEDSSTRNVLLSFVFTEGTNSYAALKAITEIDYEIP